MIRIPNYEDDARGVVTYELRGGTRVCISARGVRAVGAASIIRDMGLGHLLPTDRVPVVQEGRQIGTLPPDFDPMFIKSRSPLYDPQPGDFLRQGAVWIAARALGPGDLDAVPGFVRDVTAAAWPAS